MDTGVEEEIWENPNKGPMYIKTYNHEGKLVSTPIRPGKRIAISTKERLINQDIAASEELDMFKNGHLVPVTVAETASDYEEIMSNPNLISESEIRDLFGIKAIADFRSRLEEITNPGTLSRIKEIASDESLDPSKKQLDAIDARLEAVAPSQLRPDISVEEADSGKFIKPVFPK